MYSGVRIRFKYNCLSNQTACQFKYLRSGVRITSKKTVCDKITLGGIFRQRPAKFPMSQCCSVGCMTYLIMSMCIVKLCHTHKQIPVLYRVSNRPLKRSTFACHSVSLSNPSWRNSRHFPHLEANLDDCIERRGAARHSAEPGKWSKLDIFVRRFCLCAPSRWVFRFP